MREMREREYIQARSNHTHSHIYIYFLIYLYLKCIYIISTHRHILTNMCDLKIHILAWIFILTHITGIGYVPIVKSI